MLKKNNVLEKEKDSTYVSFTFRLITIDKSCCWTQNIVQMSWGNCTHHNPFSFSVSVTVCLIWGISFIPYQNAAPNLWAIFLSLLDFVFRNKFQFIYSNYNVINTYAVFIPLFDFSSSSTWMHCASFPLFSLKWFIIQMHGNFNGNLHGAVKVRLADGYGINVCKICLGLQVLCYSFGCYCFPKPWQLKEKKNKQREDQPQEN